MLVRSFLVIIGLCLGVVGCANTGASNSTPSAPAQNLTAAQDPDGDREDKGYNYFAMTRPATGNKVFIFDPNYDAWAVYDANGNRVNVGQATGGSTYCPDEGKPCETIVGTFKVLSKKGADCKSNIFPLKTHGGAAMPYCMFFDNRGYAIHGTFEAIPNANVSHGCIRVNPVAAKWLNEQFINVGTTVIVLPYNS